MNKKSIIISVVAAIVIILVSGFYESSKPASNDDGIFYYRQFEDSLGNTVKLQKKPKKVAVLFSSLADVWIISGGEVAVTVGESVERGICDENVLLVDKGAGKTIDTELLLRSEPDFVVYSADVPAQVKVAELLKKEKIPCAGFRLDSVEDYIKILTICTSILESNKDGAQLQDNIESLLEKAAGKSESPKILFIRSGSSKSSAKAKKAEDNFAAKMLEDLGCCNIADNAEILLDSLSIEEIIKADPEHIFISVMGDEEAGKAYMNGVMSTSLWQSLTAVKKGNVHYLPKDLFQYKPCDEWDKAYTYLYEILYGDKGDNVE